MYYTDFYPEDFLPADALEAFVPLLILIGAVLFVALVFWIINYVFRGIGMYRLAKKQGLPSPFLAWIPYARVYLNGQLAGDIPLGKKWLRKPGLWLLFLPMACSIVLFVAVISYEVSMFTTLIPMAEMGESPAVIVSFLASLFSQSIVLILLSFAGSAVNYWIVVIVHFAIYKKYRPDTVALTHSILGIFIPLYTSIYLFILGKKAPVTYVPQPVPQPYMPQPPAAQPAPQTYMPQPPAAQPAAEQPIPEQAAPASPEQPPIVPPTDDEGTGE